MKKIIIFAAILTSIGISSLSADAKPIDSKTRSGVELKSGSPVQISIQIGNKRRRRVRRPMLRTRVIYLNGRRYRETYQIQYFNNGRSRRQVIRRVRIY